MEIIIVDDEPVSLALLKQLVGKLPHCHAVGFANPAAALAWCRPNDPDAVIVNYMMPGMNGIEFAERLSALEGRADTPLLMISANPDPNIRASAVEHGVSWFMNKPFSAVELQSQVAQMITMRSKQIEAANKTIAPPSSVAADRNPASAARLMDRKASLVRLGGDERVFTDIATVFVRTVPDLLTSMQTALTTNCLDRVYSDVHSLKGAVAAFDAPQVMAALGLLEQHARTYNASAAIAAFAQVEKLCGSLIEELKPVADTATRQASLS